MIKFRIYILLLIFCIAPFIAFSQDNNSSEVKYQFSQEAKDLYKELRCLVCQNQSLLESDAPLASDIKKLINVKLIEGQTKEEVKEFLVSRYGEFILFSPTFSFKNLVLWIGPLVFILLGIFLAYKFYSKPTKEEKENNTMSKKDREKAEKILKER